MSDFHNVSVSKQGPAGDAGAAGPAGPSGAKVGPVERREDDTTFTNMHLPTTTDNIKRTIS